MFHHIMYVAPCRGRQSIGDKILMTTERLFFFAHMLQVSKWSLWNLIFYTFLMILYMYIAPGQRQKTSWRHFWCQQKAFITSTICCKFQTNLFEFWFYTHFLIFFPHVYSPRAGTDNPLWTKSWCQQKSLVTLPICCKFQKDIFEIWFYTYFFMFLYIYIALGQEQTTPWGQNFYTNINLLSLWWFAVLPVNDFLTVFPI